MRKSIPDVFVEGARKGFNIACNSVLPNVLMAFVIIQILNVTGLLKLLGDLFKPLMTVFALPGEAVTVLVSAFLSCGGGCGAAIALYNSGVLNDANITILTPAIFLMGSLLQYLGRVLGTSGVPTKHYPVMFAISISMAIVAMFIMRVIA